MESCTLPHGGRLAGLALLASLVLAPEAPAQTNPLQTKKLHIGIDSGWVANNGNQVGTIIGFHVYAADAPWVRLNFSELTLSGDPALGTGSVLKITSLADGQYQLLDSVSAAQWYDSTAYLNGDMVLVEVIAHPGTGANRVAVGDAVIGLETDPVEPPGASSDPDPLDTICGVDDRVLSSDPRAARLLNIGCTGFLIDDDCGCFMTAGHCMTGSSIAQFNVPLSTSSGGLQHPGPDDQYSVDITSRQWTNGGVGNDWAYFGVFPNSNTGLTPRIAQGSAYTFNAPPPFNASEDIRITGYGTDSTPSSHNQVQQTHFGPWFSHVGTTMRYQADTTGGNSGSPVIHEQTGSAVGIHTHGGCGSSPSSSNAGTGGNHASLQGALANPLGVCLKTVCPPPDVTFFNGGGSNTACLASQNQPVLGSNWLVDVDSSVLTGAFITGLQMRSGSSSGTFVPAGEVLIDLSSTLLLHSIEPANGGTVTHSIFIPDDPALAGTTFTIQGYVRVAGSTATLCNAEQVVFGCNP